MTPSESGSLAGLLIQQAYEIVESEDQRITAAKLKEAEDLLAGLQSHIDHIRQSAPDISDAYTEMVVNTKSNLTVKEMERQNADLGIAQSRSKRLGLPSGIRNY